MTGNLPSVPQGPSQLEFDAMAAQKAATDALDKVAASFLAGQKDPPGTHRVQLPESLQFLFLPKRYKVLYGGRGAAKSWTIARTLIAKAFSQRIRVVCGREIMKSIDGSVYKLLKDQIDAMGLNHFFDVQNTKIIGLNGSEFTFIGLRHNVNGIRSLEGVDIFWAEEAQTISKGSWDTLIPTIRKEGSEIWISFNPELDTDETYKRFVLKPPTDSFVKLVNWRENPFFNELMMKERRDKLRQDPDGYLTVWEGKTRQTLDGAIYAKEIRKAMLENRVTRVPYDSARPVSTFWDLGRSDKTSIWFAQQVGFEFHIIDFHEDSSYHIDHYMKIVQERPYTYLQHWLPHDARAKTIGTKLTVEEQMKAKGFKVKIVANLSIADGINAVRTLFDRFYFDEVKCADGLQALRRYQYEVDENNQFSTNPLHNEWSHAADAFRYLALGLQEKEKSAKIKPDLGRPGNPHANGTDWLGR